jgi:NTE family protein
MIPPRRLILSGGGIKVISIVGAIKVLSEKGHLCKVKEMCGVSAGAWMAFMLACKCPVEIMERMILDLDFGKMRNFSPDAFIGFPETFGLDDGAHLCKMLESIIRIALKVDPAITFGDMAKDTDKYFNFRCWATDLNTYKVREFSAKETPQVKIIDALRASMALPLYFTPSRDPITGHILSDGAIQGNLPLHHLTDSECQESLSIGFSNENRETSDGTEPQDLFSFINAIFSTLLHSRNEAALEKWKHTIMRIPVAEYPSWNFEACRKDKEMLLSKGTLAAKQWLSVLAHSSRKILRRHSS